MKTALIIGCEGQDGRIAFDLLAQKGYKLLGLGRGSIKDLQTGWTKPVNITEAQEVFKLLESLKIEEIYYLAAFHHSFEETLPDELNLIENSCLVNVTGLSNFLEGVKRYAPDARLFYACSSLIYGGTNTEIQNEETSFCPDTVYGISKLDGLLLCRYYRQKYNVFASAGILYNHESHFRQDKFISTKIIKAAVNISRGKQEKLVVGDLNAEVDWGYAPDYVQAMHQILQAPSSDEFIIATGIKHSVRDFARIAFEHVGLDWKKFVHQDATVAVRKRKALVGNPAKLVRVTGWRPTVDFKGMVELLMEAELKQS